MFTYINKVKFSQCIWCRRVSINFSALWDTEIHEKKLNSQEGYPLHLLSHTSGAESSQSDLNFTGRAVSNCFSVFVFFHTTIQYVLQNKSTEKIFAVKMEPAHLHANAGKITCRRVYLSSTPGSCVVRSVACTFTCHRRLSYLRKHLPEATTDIVPAPFLQSTVRHTETSISKQQTKTFFNACCTR